MFVSRTEAGRRTRVAREDDGQERRRRATGVDLSDAAAADRRPLPPNGTESTADSLVPESRAADRRTVSASPELRRAPSCVELRAEPNSELCRAPS